MGSSGEEGESISGKVRRKGTREEDESKERKSKERQREG